MGVFVLHSTKKKTKTSKQHGSSFQSRCRNGVPRVVEPVQKELEDLIYPRPGHMSTTAMLKVNFVQTVGRGWGWCVPEKISMGSKEIAFFSNWASLCVSWTSSICDYMRTWAASLRSHDQNRHPRTFQTVLVLLAFVHHGLSPHLAADSSPVGRAHGTCLLMHIQQGAFH
jgi:hypothetical protein